MALVVGLDIGTHSLTGAAIAGTQNRFRLVDFFVEKIPTLGTGTIGEPGEYVPPLSLEEFIQKTLADRNLKSADVVTCVESKDCVLRQFPVPFTRDEQIRKVVAFEAENHFPIFSMDEVVLEYLKVGESNGKSQIIAAALRNDVIQERLGMLKRVEIDPLALDLDCAALFNAFALTPLFDPAKSILLLDMGGTATKIVHIEGGKIRKIRSFRAGSAVATPDRMIAQPAAVGVGSPAPAGGEAEGSVGDLLFGGISIEARFQEIENALRRLEPTSSTDARISGDELEPEAPIAILSDEEFERVRGAEDAAGAEAAGGSKGEGAKDAGRSRFPGSGGFADRAAALEAAAEPELNYRDYLERVASEIHRTFATSASSIDLICLTGGMSDGEEARAFFNEQFDVETVAFDFGDKFPTDVEAERLPDVSKHGAVAVGLAIKEFGRDLVGIDFRKGRFRYEHRFSRLKYPLLLFSVVCFVFFLQTAFWAYHEHSRLSWRTAGFETEMKTIYKTFFGKDLAEGRDPVAAAKEQKGKWQGKGGGEMGKVAGAVEAIRNFGEVMNSTKKFFRINRMSFDLRARSGPGAGAGKKAVLQSYPSKVDITTDDNYAHIEIKKKFNEDPLSRFFDAEASASAGKDGTKVDLTLKLKGSVLSQLE